MKELLTIEKMLNCRLVAIESMLQSKALQQSILSSAINIAYCLSHGGKVITAGNGGSASQSQHFVAELMGKFHKERCPYSAISLNSDTSLLTCIGNDYGFERIFSRQILGIAKPNDVFVAFTTSGRSRNILEALNVCKNMKINSIAFTGMEQNDIDLLSDITIKIPNNDIPIIQECHNIISHIICELIENFAQNNDYISGWKDLINEHKKGCKYLILDRDGVVNVAKPNGYISNFKDFNFTEGFVANIKLLSDLYDRIFITTNQAGIGKGIMDVKDLDILHQQMLSEIKEMNGNIDKIYYSKGVDYSDNMRKPNIGMAEQIKIDFPDVDFSKTVVAGDSFSDMLFAEKIKARFILIQ